MVVQAQRFIVFNTVGQSQGFYFSYIFTFGYITDNSIRKKWISCKNKCHFRKNILKLEVLL